MKRQNQKRRLRLARETLRAITDTELDAVAGGKPAPNTQPKSNAWTGDYLDGTEYICSY